MANDKVAKDPGAPEAATRDAKFLNDEFNVRPDEAAKLSTGDKAAADKAETAVRQANSNGAVPGATTPESSSVEAASDVDEDYNKPLIKDGNNQAGPS